jgi:hypothetical protein
MVQRDGDRIDFGGGPIARAVSLVDGTTGAAVTSLGGSSSGSATTKSGTVTTGGVAQSLAALNASRKRLVFQNISGGDFWISFVGTAAPDTAGSFRIQPGDGWDESGSQIITNAVSIYGATTGQPWSAMEV